MEKTWEEETLELVEDFRRERLKAAQRSVAAQRAIETFDARIAAAEALLHAYRVKYGLAKPEVTIEPGLAVSFQGLAPREMLRRWAEQHDGLLVMNDACQFLAKAGLFTDARHAATTLYRTVKRMSEFEKLARGRYRLKERIYALVNGNTR